MFSCSHVLVLLFHIKWKWWENWLYACMAWPISDLLCMPFRNFICVPQASRCPKPLCHFKGVLVGQSGKKVQPSSHLPKNVTCSALWATTSHCSLQGSKEILGGKSNTEPVCVKRGHLLSSHMPVYAFNTKLYTVKSICKTDLGWKKFTF